MSMRRVRSQSGGSTCHPMEWSGQRMEWSGSGVDKGVDKEATWVPTYAPWTGESYPHGSPRRRI